MELLKLGVAHRGQQAAGSAHRRRLCRSSRFKVQGSKPNGLSRFSHRGGEAAVPSSRFKVQTFKLE